KNANFTRLVSYHPETKTTRMIAYPIDVDAYESPKEAKIGDIVALDQDRILIVEQGKDKNGEMRNLVYVVNMKNASDLTAFDEKQAPEFNTMAELNQRGIQLAEKELLIDLREYGWRQEKAEGLALVNDHTIALINDNDFGVQTTLVNPVGKSKMKDYSLNGDKQLMLDGKVVDTTIAIEPLPAPDNISDFWVIKFPEKI
ncbi:MAG: esterase-like activity of phytase family protein, partial [Wohlfahrtiimonas sp.]